MRRTSEAWRPDGSSKRNLAANAELARLHADLTAEQPGWAVTEVDYVVHAIHAEELRLPAIELGLVQLDARERRSALAIVAVRNRVEGGESRDRCLISNVPRHKLEVVLQLLLSGLLPHHVLP